MILTLPQWRGCVFRVVVVSPSENQAPCDVPTEIVAFLTHGRTFLLPLVSNPRRMRSMPSAHRTYSKYEPGLVRD